MQGMKKMTAIWTVFPLDLFTFPKNLNLKNFPGFSFILTTEYIQMTHSTKKA